MDIETRTAYTYAIHIWNKKLEVLDSKLISKNISSWERISVVQNMLHDISGLRRNLDWMEESLVKLLTELSDNEEK